jgi:serine phosphatase RsbU (regulator of sigma subunit)
LEKQNDKINKQNIEIEHQKNEVVAQKERIEVQQHNILDSIHYASRIQTAILPQKEVENQLFGDNIFILFKPRDIVSGDFFWLGRRNNWKIAIAADCTGHGVPGAFMSMLGTAFLNEIINDNTIQDIDAGQILNKLRDNVIKSLRQTGKAGEQKDGMDVALWMIDENTNMLRYAGANNPLIIVRKEVKELNLSEAEAERVKTQDLISETDNDTYQIIQIAGSKMPIGIYADLNPFEEVSIQLYPGDTLYTFSDGFQDQFGGVKGKKFMIKRLKQLFVDIYTLPIDEQRSKLDSELVDWIATGNTEQIDDILVIGYRV